MTINITPAILLRIAGKRTAAQASIIAAIAPMITNLAATYFINTPLRMAHFLGQTCEESDGYATLEEYASGAAYEGRKDLGNVKAGDGKRYKGRGVIQCTGRDNYRKFTAWMRKQEPSCPDFEASPELLLDSKWAVQSALWFWTTNNLNQIADKDDAPALTKRINGGVNGLAERILFTGRAKSALGGQAASPVLSFGENGADVLDWQKALIKAGFPVAADGSFGPATVSATKALQRAKGLTADGVVGPATRKATA